MSYYNQPYGQGAAGGSGAANLQFYPSSYTNVSGHTTPSQASYGGYGGSSSASAYPGYGAGASAAFGGPAGVSGRMGDSGGLRTGWLAAFGTEGYDGEPGLMEELGFNFGHIKTKVRMRKSPLLPFNAQQGLSSYPCERFMWLTSSICWCRYRPLQYSTLGPNPHLISWTTAIYMADSSSSCYTAHF